MRQEHGENRGMTILMKAELGEGQESNMLIILGDGEIKKQYPGFKMLASVNDASIYFFIWKNKSCLSLPPASQRAGRFR